MSASKALVLLTFLALAGCGRVSGSQVVAAQKACEPFGGLWMVYSTPDFKTFDAKCSDGTTLRGSVKTMMEKPHG